MPQSNIRRYQVLDSKLRTREKRLRSLQREIAQLKQEMAEIEARIHGGHTVTATPRSAASTNVN